MKWDIESTEDSNSSDRWQQDRGEKLVSDIFKAIEGYPRPGENN